MGQRKVKGAAKNARRARQHKQQEAIETLSTTKVNYRVIIEPNPTDEVALEEFKYALQNATDRE